MRGEDVMAVSMDGTPASEQDGIAHRVSRRADNRRKSGSANPDADAQGLVEFGCECNRVDCERVVKVPLDVYRRMIDADQYLLQAGHHAFTSYRTIITVGLMRIEERG
jgi:hypothetical protein